MKFNNLPLTSNNILRIKRVSLLNDDKVLFDTKQLGILLDTTTLNNLLDVHERQAIAILNLNHPEFRGFPKDRTYSIQFVRTPQSTSYKELKSIPEYQLGYEGSRIKYIEIPYPEGKSSAHAFMFEMKDIERTAQKILKKSSLNEAELNQILPVFVYAELNRYNSYIFVTNERILFKNRSWFRTHVPGDPLNIMTLEEAANFINLFLKKHSDYTIWISRNSAFWFSKWEWYWLSMRLKLPYFNVRKTMLNALADRFAHLLIALDKIGILYYSKISNTTMLDTLYHFNYFISLITGIFDNLALQTDKDLNIKFHPTDRINLTRRDFLKEIRKKNSKLRNHIASFANFINLIKIIREQVIHRQGLNSSGFGYRDTDIELETHVIHIKEKVTEIKQYLKQCGDKPVKEYPFSEWGAYNSGNTLYIVPYQFAYRVTRKTGEFINEYLCFLNYPSFIEAQMKKKDEFTAKLSAFKKNHIGF